MSASHPFNERDLEQLREHGISPERAADCLDTFAEGVPYAVLDRPCTRGDGITVLADAEVDRLCRRGEEAAREGKLTKFVPASGAASRMFQELLAARGRPVDASATVEDLRDAPEYPALREFLARLDRFAFCPQLEEALARRGEELQPLREAGRFREILGCLLDPGGMGYAALPKGLVPFHRYADDCRTPVAEHLLEACRYVRDRTGMVRVHFTVSPEHWAEVEDHVAAMCRRYEDRETSFDVTLSVQRPDTDTLAATLDNEPFREADGSLSLRPGGHGALLANLNDLAPDVVFIQNVDNVAVYAGTAVRYRKALAGLLVELQARVFHYLDGLDADPSPSLLDEASRFARDLLSVAPPDSLAGSPAAERAAFLRETLDRPLRVCGMVPSAGEPGGGPFWVRDAHGRCSLQIVESSQVDMEEPRQEEVFAASTHFNPVDLVCGVRRSSGACFDLMAFRDPRAAFIAVKSSSGSRFKTLEHPGLWNGGMAGWNTVFVEVPAQTFAPVKTVLDLLRPEHQPRRALK
ncbi:MAG: DUF4301 family protein [Deltaproteobacteria bacterium]|nr:DUF4301 family protein [Deltaproteobacteria bacterium]